MTKFDDKLLESKENQEKKHTLLVRELYYWKLASKGFMISVPILTFLTITSVIESGVFSKENNQNISSQIESLDDISLDLKKIELFVERQKENLIYENKVLNNLKEENERLKPLIAADKKILDKMFLEQEIRQKKQIWYERLYGVFIGVFSSIIASLTFFWFEKRRKRIVEVESENE